MKFDFVILFMLNLFSLFSLFSWLYTETIFLMKEIHSNFKIYCWTFLQLRTKFPVAESLNAEHTVHFFRIEIRIKHSIVSHLLPNGYHLFIQ